MVPGVVVPLPILPSRSVAAVVLIGMTQAMP
jgi:hypothetical protein